MRNISDLQIDQFPVIARRKLWYILSLFIIIPGIISLAVRGVNVGIDFKGGVLQRVSFENQKPADQEIRNELSSLSIKGLSVQTAGESQLFLRYPEQSNQDTRTTANTILGKLAEKNKVSEVGFESIGSSVATATTQSAVWAVAITSLAIMLFIAWSFRKVPRQTSAWRFGVTAIIALLHDLLFVIGAFSLIGIFLPSVEVDGLFITAVLTVLGFSLNDTIVVFDRIRENLITHPETPFEELANQSLNQTLVRSLNTSFTVLIVLVSLLVLGGESIRNFILALTLGVAVGTYSSIFTATPLLVSWQLWADNRKGSAATAKPVKASKSKPKKK